MSQYIQGVVDYVPMIQPFQPDLNFFQNVLQLKESQYKAGYDKLSSLYGTLLNSPMSREDNIELRNTFFNDISAQIQKISTLDLSKSQNIDAAYKVFQPLIDNDYILKDMSHTKAAYDQIKYGESLRNCTDPKKCPDQYWDGGIRLIQYQMDQFKKAEREKTLTMANPRFVPKVNLSKQAMDYAKEMNFKITIPSHSSDGRWIVHTTNGPNMIPGLGQTFMSVFGEDQKALDYYNALSILKRNDYMSSEEAIQKHGSAEAAEMYYLDQTHKDIVDLTQKALEESRSQEAQASNKKATIDGIISNRGVDPNDPDDKKLIQDRYQTMVDEMISASNADAQETDLNTVAGDDFDSLDLDAKRYRIDSVAARTLMQNDLYQAANDYAMQTMDVKMEADPYALKQYDHALNMARMRAQHAYDKDLDDYKTENQKERYRYEKTLDIAANLYPNNRRNGSTPEGANPNNPGYKKLPASPGGSAIVDIKEEDQKQIISATAAAQSSAADVVQKAYDQLTSIINTANGSALPGGAVMDESVRAYYKAKRDEIFGKSKTITAKEAAATTDAVDSFAENLDTFTYIDYKVGDLFNKAIDAISSLWQDDKTQTTTTGGYLNENNQLSPDFTENKDFSNPKSPYYWENTADRIVNFFENDPIGRRSLDLDHPESGVLGASSTYKQQKKNYQDFIEAQAKNNTIVHNLTMNNAGVPILEEMSNYPVARDSGASLMRGIIGTDAPPAIAEHTKQSLNKINANGRLLTLPEFTQLYANSPEARKVAESVMRDYYKTRPGDQGDSHYYSYEDGVNELMSRMEDDAEDLYQEYMDQFTLIYNQANTATNKEADKAGFKPLSMFYQNNDAGAGVQADPIYATVDAAYPGDTQAIDFVEFYEKIVKPEMGKEDPNFEVYAGLGTDIVERGFFKDDVDPVQDPEGALTAIQALRMNLMMGADGDDKTRAIFDFHFLPIAGNDPNKMAFAVSVNPEFTDAHLGSGKVPKFMAKTNRQFTIVVDKEEVPAVEKLEMVKRLQQGPYTIAMRAHNRIDLNDFTKGGKISIFPSGNDSYVASGYTNYIDEETLKTRSMEYTAFMGPNETLENFAQRQNRMLYDLHAQVATAQEQIKAMSATLIRDPNQFN